MRTVIRSGVSFAAMALAATVAHAQTTPPQNESAPVDATGLNDGDIVVTAQKRSERLQDVPLSIQAITGADLAARQLNEFSELQTVTPSVYFAQSNHDRGAALTVRGVGTSGQSEGIEDSVGIVLDGVPIGRGGGAFTDLVDLDHIEVLRGPQGTLFGKNASAGLINIVTQRPSRNFSFAGSVSYGEDDDVRLRANLSGPLTADGALRFRATGYYSRRDGDVRDVSQGLTLNDRNEYGFRAKLEWDITSNLNLLVTGDISHRDSKCCIWTNRDYGAGLYGSGVNPIRTYQAALGIVASPSNRRVDLGGPVYQRSTTKGVAIEANWTLPNEWVITSITGVRSWRAIDSNDADSTPLDILDLDIGDVTNTQESEELRVATPAGRPVEATAGLFYFRSKNGLYAVQGGSLGLDLLRLAPVGAKFARAGDWTADAHNYAVFGDGTWHLTPELRVFGGARYTRQDVDYNYGRYGVAGYLQFPGSPVSPGRSTGSRRDTDWSWRIGGQYEFKTDAMAYATVSRGYKGGGFNLLLDTPTVSPTSTVPLVAPISPETATNYEAGIKTQWFDRRFTFNVSLFNTDFSNFQATSVVTSGGNFTFQVINAGKLRTRGIEVETSIKPVTGLTLSANGSFNDAVYRQFVNAPCWPGQVTFGTGCALVAPGTYAQDLSGHRLGAPKFTYNLDAQYRTPISDQAEAFGNIAWFHRSRQNTSLSEDPASVQPAFGILSGSLGITFDQRYTVRLFGKNILNRNYSELIFATPFDSGTATTRAGHSQFLNIGAQRTLGAALEVRF